MFSDYYFCLKIFENTTVGEIDMVVTTEPISRTLTLSITIYFRCACSDLAVESIKDSPLIFASWDLPDQYCHDFNDLKESKG